MTSLSLKDNPFLPQSFLFFTSSERCANLAGKWRPRRFSSCFTRTRLKYSELKEKPCQSLPQPIFCFDSLDTSASERLCLATWPRVWQGWLERGLSLFILIGCWDYCCWTQDHSTLLWSTRQPVPETCTFFLRVVDLDCCSKSESLRSSLETWFVSKTSSNSFRETAWLPFYSIRTSESHLNVPLE